METHTNLDLNSTVMVMKDCPRMGAAPTWAATEHCQMVLQPFCISVVNLLLLSMFL